MQTKQDLKTGVGAHSQRRTTSSGQRGRPRPAFGRLLLVLAMLATSFAMADSAAAQAGGIEVEVSCLANNGRLDISYVADVSATYFIHVGTLAPRQHVATAGDVITEVVTGRRDGPISVDIRSGGVIVAETTATVACDADSETRVTSSCLSGNGRIDVWVVGPGNGAAPTEIDVTFERDNGPNIGPRTSTLFRGEERRFTTTGRPDDGYRILVQSAIGHNENRVLTTIFDERVTVSCDAPGEPVTFALSCLAENGRLDFDLFNDANTTSTFIVSVPPLADRVRTVAAGASARVSYTGRPDTPIDASVQRDGATVWQQTVTPDCDPASPDPDPVDNSLGALPSGADVASNDSPFVSVELRQAENVPDADEQPVTVVAGPALDEATTAALLDRLPDLVADEGDQVEFRPPEVSLPRPSSFDTIPDEFPPPSNVAPVVVPNVPLEVLRFQPEGETSIAPFLSVTFSQPMVPLGAIGEIEAAASPAQLTPATAGQWTWIGTRTLRFEHVGSFDRLPGATEYTVTVPAGTTSASGNALSETVQWSFSTSPATLEFLTPYDGEVIDLDQVFVARFDQLIDTDAVLAATSLRVAGVTQAVRQATDEELAADPRVARVLDAARPGYAIALRAVNDFPTDTPIRVEFANLPSAEGPLLQPERLGSSYRTYGPFEIVSNQCGYRGTCRPYDSLGITVSNSFDRSLVDLDDITISPEIPGARLSLGSRSIWIRGTTTARTTYTVTLPTDLTDIFGQTITGNRTVTFDVGDAEPSLNFLNGQSRLVTLDPFLDEPVIDYTVVNLDSVRIQAIAVDASDWPAWVGNFNQSVPESGRIVYDEVISTGVAPNEPTSLTTDLGDALVEHDFVIVRFISDDPRQPVRHAWVQATQLGVDVTNDNDELRVWVTNLRTGEPVENATVADIDGSPRATTNADGSAVLPLTSQIRALTVTSGSDRAIMPRGTSSFGWSRNSLSDQLRWHTFDDRKLYRPGETVNIKGWLRLFTEATDARIAPSSVSSVNWRVTDPVGNELATGTAAVSALGGFDVSFATPTNANLGRGRVQFTAVNADGRSESWSHVFSLQEFRRPEFEVETDVASPAPHFAGSTAIVEAQAAYFAGGALRDADVRWTVTTRPTRYRPPGWDDFGFGAYRYSSEIEYYSGTTGPDGVHPLELDFQTDPEAFPVPVSVTADADVTDVNQQRIRDGATLLVHPADRYVGLRTERAYVRIGESLDVDAIVTDLDGAATPGVAITVEAARVVGQWADGAWTSQEVDGQTCSRTSAAAAVNCSFEVETGGRWIVRASIKDGSGRPNATEVTRWAAGGRLGTTDRVARESLELIADRSEYQPGDTAQVLVIAPFDSGHGIVTLARNGIVEQSTFEITDSTAEIAVPIDAAMMPNLWLQVEAVGATDRTDGSGVLRPAYAGAIKRLDIPPRSKELSVEVTPASAAITPGASTAATVRVVDAAGSPVAGAEVAVVAVDEAVLALTDFSLPDPLASFWQTVGSRTSTTHGRARVVLSSAFAGPDEIEFVSDDAELAVPGVADSVEAGRGAASAVATRTDFDPLAVFAPEVRTAADGSAIVNFDVPDNLTRYRLYAVAVSDADRFGSGESSFTARLPLMARPSAPRFANFGDEFVLPVVVQNQTDADAIVDVAIRATNLDITNAPGRRVTIPANDRRAVHFAVAADEAGTARFQVIAASGPNADAAEIALPVLTPATSESFATYGVLDEGATAQPIVAPSDVYSQFGGLEIGTSTTALHSLSDAVLHLSRHRYTSATALSSRIVAIAALDDVLPAFGAEGLPSPEALRAVVARDITDLLALQNNDGGFGSWRRGDQSWPWASTHASHALVVAQLGGYPVPQEPLDRALGYLESIEERFPENYPLHARDSLSAYALHVRDLAGDRDTAKATALFRSDLDIEALAWIWPVVDAPTATEIARVLNNRVVETPSSASFATDARDGDWLILRSNRRTDAIVLDALMRMDADNDLIPKVVAGLQAQQRNGRWNSLGENAFALLAFDRYFRTFEATDPDLVARVWLGDLYAAEHDHPERSTDRIQTVVPMSEVLSAGDTDIVVQDDGVGRLYWRLGLRYAPTDLELEPLDRGFVVQRTYESLGDPDDVVRQDNGTWQIKPGADVLVKVTMVADSVRSHVALIDPLPAGLEPLNPRVSVAQPQPFDDFLVPIGVGDAVVDFGGCRFCGSWFNHQNLRDDRAEAFSTYLWGGTYTYTYVASATTSGRFVTPPARAEMIHEPEVFGRSASDIVVIREVIGG